MKNKVTGLPPLRCETCEHELGDFRSESLDTILNPQVKDGDTVDFSRCYRFETRCLTCPDRHEWVYRGPRGVARQFEDYQLHTGEDDNDNWDLWEPLRDWLKSLFGGRRRAGKKSN